MKKILLFIMILGSLVYMLSCADDNTVIPPESGDETDVIVEAPEQEGYTGEKINVDGNDTPETEIEEKTVVYTNSNGNISNGGIVLDCGEYLYYDMFRRPRK